MRSYISKILFPFTLLLFLAFSFSGNPPQGWYLQTLPINNIVKDIFFLDSLTGWIATDLSSSTGDSAFILKTTNGGDNWIKQFGEKLYWTKIQFLNYQTGYASAGSNIIGRKVYKTTNGGVNWVQRSLGIGSLIDDMHFINTDTGWVCDHNTVDGGILKTTNGGTSFFYQLNETYNIYALDFPSRDTGYAINLDKLYKTTNSGTNWSLLYTFPFSMGQAIDGINFLNSQTGWATRSTENFIYKTTTGGSNWFKQYGFSTNDSLVASRPTRISILNKDTIWATGGIISYGGSNRRGLPLITTNGGDTWGYQLPDTSINISAYNFITFVSKKHGWLYQNTGKGIHTTIGGKDTTYYITGINSPITELPKNFILYQNYPNPFNPVTSFKFQVSNSNYISLKVHDLQGKEIATLINNERKAAGTYSINFDASKYNLASGIYFYKLDVEKDNVSQSFTKTMVLIK